MIATKRWCAFRRGAILTLMMRSAVLNIISCPFTELKKLLKKKKWNEKENWIKGCDRVTTSSAFIHSSFVWCCGVLWVAGFAVGRRNIKRSEGLNESSSIEAKKQQKRAERLFIIIEIKSMCKRMVHLFFIFFWRTVHLLNISVSLEPKCVCRCCFTSPTGSSRLPSFCALLLLRVNGAAANKKKRKKERTLLNGYVSLFLLEKKKKKQGKKNSKSN